MTDPVRIEEIRARVACYDSHSGGAMCDAHHGSRECVLYEFEGPHRWRCHAREEEYVRELLRRMEGS